MRRINLFRAITAAFVIVVAMCCVSSCDIFGNEKSGDDDGWVKKSLPANLKGEWYANFYYESYALKITSTTLYDSTREWKIQTVELKDGQYRLSCMSMNQYRVYYFTDLGTLSVKKTMGLIAFTLYDAKESDVDAWVSLTKKSS